MEKTVFVLTKLFEDNGGGVVSVIGVYPSAEVAREAMVAEYDAKLDALSKNGYPYDEGWMFIVADSASISYDMEYGEPQYHYRWDILEKRANL